MTKCLIVDDNSANLYLLKSMLEGKGWDVHEAENGKVALEMAHAKPLDMIVSDILMPVMDGYTLCRQCKLDEKLKNIPFVFYTATYTEPRDERFALDLGADRFIIKPQEPEILINILIDLLDEKNRVRPMTAKPLGEEMEFFRRHNETLFRKLEKKMSELETTNQKFGALEETYRLSFENVSDVIYTIDTNLNILTISPSIEKILGYKPQDFIGRSVSDIANILTPESFKQAVANISLVLNGETIPATIYEFIAKDGTIKVGEVSGAPIMRDGKVAGLISVARDITERKKAEEEIRRRDSKYQQLIEHAEDGIFTINVKGQFILANAKFCQMLGCTNDECLQVNILDTYPDDIRMVGAQRMVSLQRKEALHFERPMKRRDGGIVFVEASAWTDDDGNIQAIVRDITDRKLIEQALRNSEERFKAQYHGSSIPTFTWQKIGADFVLVDCNNAAVTAIGGNAKKFINKTASEMYHDQQDILQDLHRCF